MSPTKSLASGAQGVLGGKVFTTTGDGKTLVDFPAQAVLTWLNAVALSASVQTYMQGNKEKGLNQPLSDAFAWWMANATSEKVIPKKHLDVLLKHGVVERDGDELNCIEPLFSLIWNHGKAVAKDWREAQKDLQEEG